MEDLAMVALGAAMEAQGQDLVAPAEVINHLLDSIIFLRKIILFLKIPLCEFLGSKAWDENPVGTVSTSISKSIKIVNGKKHITEKKVFTLQDGSTQTV